MSKQRNSDENEVEQEEPNDEENNETNLSTQSMEKSLLDFVKAKDAKKKKNKGGNISDTSSTASISGKKGKNRPKKIVIDTSGDIKSAFLAAQEETNSGPSETANPKQSHNESAVKAKPVSSNSEVQKYADETAKYSAILATVGGQISEGDVMRICQNFSKIHSRPGYFIIDFEKDEFLTECVKKNNKTMYKNDITILMDTYSQEDEHPKSRQNREDSRGGYDGYGNDYSSYQIPSIAIGTKSKNSEPMSQPYSKPRTPGFQFGTKTQNAPVTQQPPPQQKNSNRGIQIGGRKQGPFNRFTGEQERPQQTIETAANKFGALRDDD